MPEMIRRECPIEACSWWHDEPDPIDGIDWTADEAALAESDGDFIPAIVMYDARRVDRILRGHFESHPLIDWVQEVAKLREQLAAAQRPGALA